MSTTTEHEIAYRYAGGDEGARGTIMELEFDAASRGANVKFLSCAPYEEEWLLPPLTMISCKREEERGDPPHVKRCLICTITVNPTALDMEGLTDDFDARPQLKHAGGGGGKSEPNERLLHEAVLSGLPSHFLCPFTNSIMEDPVYASDGFAYERENLRAWMEERRTSGEHLVSPLTHEGIDYKMTEAAELKAEITAHHNSALQRLIRAGLYVTKNENGNGGSSAKGGGGLVAADADSLKSMTQGLGLLAATTSSAARTGGVGLHGVSVEQTGIARIDRLAQVFGVLDRLHGMLAETTADWKTPMFVVLGAESCGKSTILERVTMLPIFPRADGLCTRMPIKIQLRRTPEPKPPTLERFNLETKQTEGPPRTITLSGKMDVRLAMEDAMRAECGVVTGISRTHMLILSVNSPDVPNLDLVDLPGLVSARRANEPDDLPEQSEELLRNFILDNKEHALFLAVVRATTPPNTAPVLGKLIQELEVEKQTLGIFSMCDEFADSYLENTLVPRLTNEARDGVPLKPHGYIATMNAPVSEGNLTSAQRLEKQAIHELEWFRDKPGVQSVLNHEGRCLVGSNALIEKMDDMFCLYVRQTWAPIAAQKLAEYERELQVDA